jgi:hypothetical protein
MSQRDDQELLTIDTITTMHVYFFASQCMLGIGHFVTASPRTWKLHLSIALGLKACQGFSLRFTTPADLIATLTQAHPQASLRGGASPVHEAAAPDLRRARLYPI